MDESERVDMTPLESFAELTDRILSAPIALAAWCPTMDLLAVAFTDGRIAVHRLNWQRLWLVTPDAAPTALSWTPSGDALAVGRADGAVSLLAAETGDVVGEDRCEGSGSVTALTWVEELDPKVDGAAVPQLALQGRARRFCPPPPTAIPTKPTSQGGSAEVKAGWQPAAAKLTLLGVAYQSGSVRICTAALLELTHLTPSRLRELGLSGGGDTEDTAAGITQVAISRDLGHLLMLRQAGGEERLEILSTTALAQTAAQLRYQAPLTSEVLDCLSSAREAVAAAGREWGDAAAAVAERVAALQGLLRDNMDACSPAAELRRLLASGAVSDPLRQWLTASLGEAGLQRLARQVDGNLAAAAQLLGNGVAAAVRVAAFQLGDIAGLAHAPCHLPASGLQAAQLERARGLAAQLLVRCEQMRMAVTAAAADYRRLCAWLLQWIRRLDEDADSLELGPSLDVLALAGFIDTQFQQDRIGPELQTPQQGQAAPEGLPAIGGGACELLALAGLSPAAADTHLWSLVRDLEQAARAGLCATSAALSPTLQSLLSMRLRSTPTMAEQGQQPMPTARLRLRQVPAEDGDPQTAWVAWTGTAKVRFREEVLPHVGVLRVTLPPPGAAAQEPVVEAGAVQLPAGKVVDTGFYQDGRLAVLLQRQGPNTGTASLMLVPLLAAPEPLPAEQRDGDILQGCVDRGAWRAPVPRQRTVPHGDVAPPLAVSGPRGVACVATALPRALLYDLEAEDEEDDGEGDDDQEDDGDNAMPEDA